MFPFNIESISMIPKGFGRSGDLYSDIFLGGESNSVLACGLGNIDNSGKGDCWLFKSTEGVTPSPFQAVFNNDKEIYPSCFATDKDHNTFIVTGRKEIYVFWSEAINRSFDWKSLLIEIAIMVAVTVVTMGAGAALAAAAALARAAVMIARAARLAQLAAKAASVGRTVAIAAGRLIRPVANAARSIGPAATKIKNAPDLALKLADKAKTAATKGRDGITRAADEFMQSEPVQFALYTGADPVETAAKNKLLRKEVVAAAMYSLYELGDTTAIRTYSLPGGEEFDIYEDPASKTAPNAWNMAKLTNLNNNAKDVTKIINTFTDADEIEEFLQSSTPDEDFYRSLITIPKSFEPYTSARSFESYQETPKLHPKTDPIIEEFACGGYNEDSKFVMYASSVVTTTPSAENFRSNNIEIEDIRKIVGSKDRHIALSYLHSETNVYVVYFDEDKKYNLRNVIKTVDTIVDIACSNDGVDLYVLTATPALQHCKITDGIKTVDNGVIATKAPVFKTTIYALPTS